MKQCVIRLPNGRRRGKKLNLRRLDHVEQPFSFRGVALSQGVLDFICQIAFLRKSDNPFADLFQTTIPALSPHFPRILWQW
jgi:hypothetical protein